jgi:hypothetical protein
MQRARRFVDPLFDLAVPEQGPQPADGERAETEDVFGGVLG